MYPNWCNRFPMRTIPFITPDLDFYQYRSYLINKLKRQEGAMQKYYVCPHCKGHLKVGENIIFTARNQKNESGLLLLHPKIGNYDSIKHPSFSIRKGETLDFYCPLCSASLVSRFDRNLAHVIMMDKDRKEYDIYFSRIAGEKSTYRVAGDSSVMAAGEHSHRYTYFKMPEKLKKYLDSR